MKMISFILSLFLLLVISAYSQKPSGVAPFPQDFHKKLTRDNSIWNPEAGVLNIKKSVVFGGDDEIEEYFWQVPISVQRIIIEKGVIVTGGFRTDHGLIIEGNDRNTSKVFGTQTKEWKIGRVDQGWKYAMISAKGIPDDEELVIRSLTLENSRTFNVHSPDSKIIVDRCTFINTRGKDEKSNNDGFVGGPGSAIMNSFLAVNDDIIKIYSQDMLVENVTIKLHSRNSVAFQMGWDDKPDNNASATLRNVLVIGAAENFSGKQCSGKGLFLQKPGYNKGIFVWSGGSEPQRRVITLQGFKVTNLDNSYMYSPDCSGWVPTPLFNLWRSKGQILLTGKEVYISIPQGSYPKKGGSIDFCGVSTSDVGSFYECGGANVTGDAGGPN